MGGTWKKYNMNPVPINKCKIVIKNIKANGFSPKEGKIDDTMT